MNVDRSGLLDRHLAFVEALRGAGLSVSLAEDLDAVAALAALKWSDRATVRDAFAATMVKKQSQRTTFDALFDVYFPLMVGDGGSQCRDARAGRVLVLAGADGGDRGLRHLGGTVLVGEALPEVDGADAHGQGAHLGEDGRPHRPVSAEQARSSRGSAPRSADGHPAPLPCLCSQPRPSFSPHAFGTLWRVIGRRKVAHRTCK